MSFSLNFEFLELHQVHENKVVEATSEIVKADGHFTDKKNKALLIRTADCLPVMIESHSQIFAFHCGWRSLVKDIVGKNIKKSEISFAAYGPHIQKNSFEIDQDCHTQIKDFSRFKRT